MDPEPNYLTVDGSESISPIGVRSLVRPNNVINIGAVS